MGRFLNRGGEIRIPEISQVEFMESVNDLLETATDPQTKLSTSIESAEQVSKKLEAVKNNKIHIQPPLTHEQYSGLRDRTQTIISIGEKATHALSETTAADTDRTGRGFKGTGSGAKS